MCLFVKDLDKTDREYEKTVQHYQDLLRQNGITCISKVITVFELCLKMWQVCDAE